MKKSIIVKLEWASRYTFGGDSYKEIEGYYHLDIPQAISRVNGEALEEIKVTFEGGEEEDIGQSGLKNTKKYVDK